MSTGSPSTLLVRSGPVSAELDTDVYLKRKDSLTAGAFEGCGGVNLGNDHPAAFRDPALIAAHTGYHGQSVAFDGRTAGIQVSGRNLSTATFRTVFEPFG